MSPKPPLDRAALLLLALAVAPATALAAPAAAPASSATAPATRGPSSRMTAPPMSLPFIDDDYAKALAEAKRRNLPIFVEAWAPWCHSCRSMRAYVFTDESLRPLAGRCVWLAIDGENPKNAGLRRRLALNAFPSFFAIDPRDERVAFRWVGSFTSAQFPRLLDAAEAAVRGGVTPLDRAVVRADSLYAAGADSAAADAYRAVLAQAPAGDPRRARCFESLLFALSSSDQPGTAAELAAEALPSLGRSAHAATVAASGLDAAVAMPETAPGRAAHVAALEPAVASFAADTTIAMAGDDRSGLWISLIGARDDAKDSLGMHRASAAWAAQLERDAARATSPEQRAVYDSHRLSAYIELGEPQRAIPMLEQSERDFPWDYNPPARLALAYKEMKRWPEARAASDRALSRVYGPRTLNVYRVRVDILMGAGDTGGAKQALTDAIAMAKALPAGQRPESTIQSFEKRLATLN